jgi:hypothetical protein
VRRPEKTAAPIHSYGGDWGGTGDSKGAGGAAFAIVKAGRHRSGAAKPHSRDDALASVNVKLSDDETTSLEEPYAPHAVVGFV